ncbi:putative peptidoglycan lipid II flippase [Klugiella xanthotipulae]|uniref:Putative peptidoglycan lipid II flippase n=1 Tax=Klugiella xanthotipulae TaxID=244735 RepID=A0A543HZ17_9MICO|nr:putative peptidoglycan lipid II flippase [Klugiella xanthotipulae]
MEAAPSSPSTKRKRHHVSSAPDARIDNHGRATLWLASGTVISRVTGFLSAIILARTIGTVGLGADAFTVANSLPNNIYILIAGGVLNAVLVPQIVRAARAPDGGLSYINKLVTLAIVMLGGATVILTAAVPLVVAIYGVSYIGTPIITLAIAFGLWCMPQIFFYGLYTVLGEVLNARKMFGPFTWAPIINNVVAIGGMFVFMALFGADPSGTMEAGMWGPAQVAVLAGSATLGVLGQALVLTLFWRRAGLSFKFDFNWRGVGLRSAGRASTGVLGIMIAGQIAFIITTNVMLGADIGDASVNVLKLSWLVFVLPHSIITVSITTAHFTTMSQHAISADLPAVQRDFSEIVRTVALPLVLAMCGVMVLSMPLARLFAENREQAGALALVIVGQMAWLIFYTLIFVAQRTFYALGNARAPLIFFTGQYALQSVFSVIAGLTVPSHYLAFALALAQGIAMMLTAPFALYWLGKKLGVGLDGRRVSRTLLACLGAGAGASLVGWLLTTGMGANAEVGFGATTQGSVVTMVVVGLVMSTLYLTILWLLRLPELRTMAEPVLKRLRA